jgi:lactoylglutathione lyase
VEIQRTGIVLYTERYADCVAFCRKAIGLRVLFENDELTCFDFGGSYLMVEPSCRAQPAGKTAAQNPTCLRLNVTDVKHWAEHLQALGIEVTYREQAWGAVAKFFDPDGNLWALRDETSFAAQLGADTEQRGSSAAREASRGGA